MIKPIRFHLLPALLLALVCVPAQAGEATEQLRTTIDAVLATVQDKSLAQEPRRAKLKEVIYARFDFRAMSQRVLARHWKRATPEQQDRFIEVFAELLANTYLSQIEAYTNERVEYTGEKVKKQKYAMVDTKIITKSQEIPVTYRTRVKDGEWLVYDVVVEGVSLISNYRTSFGGIVSKDGMDGLIAQIEEKLTEPVQQG